MAGNDVTIQLIAKDGASNVFKTVGRSASDMGKQVDTAGKTSEASLGRMSKAGAVAGAAVTGLAGVLSLASHANAEAEASQARLTTAIENSGHSVDEYQTQLDAASKKALQLGFDDEDAADSIAKMTTATGDAGTAISDLSIAEDIARARKIDLASATNIVIAAEQGRIGALKRVGIEVDASMSKEQIMDALRQKFAGNADAYSQTTAAGFDRMRNSVENALEALGSHLGPVNALLMALPTLSAGFTGVGAALGALIPLEEGATLGATALEVAMGPVGIAAALIAAAGAALYFSGILRDDVVAGAKESAQATDEATDALKRYQQAGSPQAVLQKELIDDLGFITDANKNEAASLADATDKKKEAVYWLQQITNHTNTSGHDQAYWQAQLDASNATLNSVNATSKDYTITLTDLATAQTAATAIIGDSGPAADDARAKLQSLHDQQQAGTLGWADYVKQVIALGDALPGANQAMIESTAATQKNTDAINGGTEAGKEFIQVYTGYLKTLNLVGRGYTMLDGQVTASTKHVTDYTNTLTGAGQGTKVLGDQFTDMGDSAGSAGDTLITTTRAQNESAAAAKGQAAAFTSAAEAIGYLDTGLEKLVASGVSTWAERTANRVNRASETLSALNDVIITGTKNISSQAQGINDWAIELINVQGVYGKIDDLYAHGQITLTTYNHAQEAGNRIFADNAAIQEDLLRIQTKQAPLIADATDQYAKYIDQLADLPPQQELVALGWMDANEAAKANAALNLAAAAAAGDYGDAGEAAATAAITAQARADPAFAAMLEDMGVISMGADGTITVNFPTASTVHDDTVNLTASIDALTLALGGIPPNVETTITATDEASSVAADVRRQLDALNGYYANATISVGLVGPGVGYTPGFDQLGGMIPSGNEPQHAQHGASLSGWSWVGEAGPELIHAPGAQVIPHTASVETSRGGGTGGPTYHIQNLTVVANDPRQFSDQMRSFNFGYGARS